MIPAAFISLKLNQIYKKKNFWEFWIPARRCENQGKRLTIFWRKVSRNWVRRDVGNRWVVGWDSTLLNAMEFEKSKMNFFGGLFLGKGCLFLVKFMKKGNFSSNLRMTFCFLSSNRRKFRRELFFSNKKFLSSLLANILWRSLKVFSRRPISISISKEIQKIFGKKKFEILEDDQIFINFLLLKKKFSYVLRDQRNFHPLWTWADHLSWRSHLPRLW